jgi:hypothetical protein
MCVWFQVEGFLGDLLKCQTCVLFLTPLTRLAGLMTKLAGEPPALGPDLPKGCF